MAIDAAQSYQRPAVTATLLLMLGAVGFMAVFFGLYALLGVGMVWAGLLFLVYWGAILRQDLATFFPAVLGGLAGILLGWLLIGLPPLVGLAGTILSYAALAAVLFCFMRRQAGLVVNNATMLYLTVATVGNFHIATDAPMMAAALLLAAAYMGGVAGAMHLAMHRPRRATPEVAI